jgi:uncharacterized protein YndB with AHSA1/START domain
MTICFEQSIFLPRSPEQVFDAIDDLSIAPKWLDGCIRMHKHEHGPNRAGDALRYIGLDGLRRRVMEGRIASRQPAEHLSYQYADRSMAVSLAFTLRAHGAGTYLTHSVAISPKGLFARLKAPLIRRALPLRTTSALARLRHYLLSAAGTH